jgi:hypothetical protein
MTTKTETERERRGRELMERFAGGGSKPARERELAEQTAPRCRPPQGNEREHERAITRAAMSGRDLENNFDPMALEGHRHAAAPPPRLTPREQERLRRAKEASNAFWDEQVEVGAEMARSRVEPSLAPAYGEAAPDGGWEQMVGAAQAEQARAVVGGERVSPYTDPDEDKPRPGEVVLARAGGPTVGGAGRAHI